LSYGEGFIILGVGPSDPSSILGQASKYISHWYKGITCGFGPQKL